MGNMLYNSNLAIAKIAKIRELISKKEMSSTELCEKIFTSRRSINGYLRFLKLNNFIYIHKYKLVQYKDKKLYCPFYKFGNLPDAIKPKPKTPAEKYKTYREKMLKDDELRDFFLAKRRQLAIKPKQDWTTSWIKR